MVAQSPDSPKLTRRYREGLRAISELVHQDGSWSGRERNVFYLNLGEGRFIDVSGAVGLDFPEDGRAYGLLDLDGDGDLDLVLKNRNAPQVRILRNDTPTGNHSIAFRLVGRESNRDAVGALIELETPQRRRLKQLQLGSGFLSQSSMKTYFGLGASPAPLRATIIWPSGRRQTLLDLPADHLITVVEGEPDWHATPFRPRNFDLTSCPVQQPLNPGVRPEGYAFLDRVPTPNFRLPDLSGKVVTAASLRGRPLLLNFWATWCVPCQKEMQQWKKHYAEIRAAGAELVALSVDEPKEREQVERFVAERGLPFRVLLMDGETLRRYDIFYRGLFNRSTGLQIPTTFLLDAQGELVKLYRGLTPLEVLQKDLRALQEEPETLVEAALPYPGWRFLGRFARDYRQLGESFFDHGLWADARLYFEKAVARQPGDGVAWNFLGIIHARQGELERARQALERAVELRPDLGSAYSALGMVYFRLKQSEKAEEMLAQAIERAPDDPELFRQYARILAANGKWEQAEQWFRAYLELEPGDAASYNALGVLYARRGILPEAQASFAKALEIKPDYADASKNLGLTYLLRGMGEAAIEPLERAIRLKPRDADTYNMLGYAYMQSGRTAEARQAFEKVLELRPGDSKARKALEELRPLDESGPP